MHRCSDPAPAPEPVRSQAPEREAPETGVPGAMAVQTLPPKRA